LIQTLIGASAIAELFDPDTLDPEAAFSILFGSPETARKALTGVHTRLAAQGPNLPSPKVWPQASQAALLVPSRQLRVKRRGRPQDLAAFATGYLAGCRAALRLSELKLLPPLPVEMGYFDHGRLVQLLPSLQFPALLARQHYLIAINAQDDDGPVKVCFYSVRLRPLCKQPLDRNCWDAVTTSRTAG
jgi:hypothetical protein